MAYSPSSCASEPPDRGNKRSGAAKILHLTIKNSQEFQTGKGQAFLFLLRAQQERVATSTTCTASLRPHMHVAFLSPPNLPSFSVVCNSEIGHRIEFPHSNARHEVTINGHVKLTAGHHPCHLGFLIPHGCSLYSPCPSPMCFQFP